MARIRSVHPGLFTDDAFLEASVPARLLIIGIWTEADDQGVFEWKPMTLRVRIYPGDNMKVEPLLNELERLDFVCRFEAKGKEYGAVRNFRKWQRPKNPTVTHPLPDDMRSYVGLAEDSPDPGLELRRRKHAEQGGECAYCRTEITYYSKKYNSLEIDHVVPKFNGGGDEDSNLVAACRACNRSKGTMTADEFRAVIAKRVLANGEFAPAYDGANGEVANAKVAKGGANFPTSRVNGEVAPQMEEEGCRREDGGFPVEEDNTQSSNVIHYMAARAKP